MAQTWIAGGATLAAWRPFLARNGVRLLKSLGTARYSAGSFVVSSFLISARAALARVTMAGSRSV